MLLFTIRIDGQSLLEVLAALGHHVAQAAGQLLHVVNVQELVGAVRVGVRAKDASDQELAAGPHALQQAHQRNGAAFSKADHLVSVEDVGGLLDCVFEVRLVLSRVPACRSAQVQQFGLGAVGNIGQQNFFESGLCLFDGEVGRESDADTNLSGRMKDIACSLNRRNSGLPSHSKGWMPVPFQQGDKRICRNRLCLFIQGEAVIELRSHIAGKLNIFLIADRSDVSLELGVELSCFVILNSTEQQPCDPVDAWKDTAIGSRVHSLQICSDLESGDEMASKRSGQPYSIVIQ